MLQPDPGIDGSMVPDATPIDTTPVGHAVEHATILFSVPTVGELILCAVIATLIWGFILICYSAIDTDKV